MKLILDFKNEVFEPKKVDDPDSDWVYDEDYVPEGWRMKRYSYNSGVTKKKEEVSKKKAKHVGLFLASLLCRAEELAQHAAIQQQRQQPMLKNLRSCVDLA